MRRVRISIWRIVLRILAGDHAKAECGVRDAEWQWPEKLTCLLWPER